MVSIDMRQPVPRPEYPRLDMDRSSFWMSLNGQWDFESEEGTVTITVPFAWGTRASGVARPWLEHAVYSRRIEIPGDWQGRRVVLCFGAVHHSCEVRVDGAVVGEHVGGYEPFEIDLGDRVRAGGGYELSVEVTAPIDKRRIPHGKQRSIPRDDYDGVSFTPTSGIWQSVWLEGRGSTYVRRLGLTTESLHTIDLRAELAGSRVTGTEVRVRVVETGQQTVVTSGQNGRVFASLPLDEPHLWSPDDPYLYHLEVVTGTGADADRLVATTGLRRVEIEGHRILLNGDRVFLRGVLDQGYWPDSGMTAPSLEALRLDLVKARDLGFTVVRKHLKLEDPLWLHEADTMGMLVWEEPACPSRFSDEAATAFEAQLPAMVERDGNHPCIVVWGLYNEEWGLDWGIPGSSRRREAVVRAYEIMKQLDSSRPVVENSGWSHVRTDLVDWHYYEPSIARWRRAVGPIVDGSQADFPVRLAPDFVVDKPVLAEELQSLRDLPSLNSEYGEGMTSLERAWHLRWQTQELRRHDDLAGYVYTELTDVEHEMAGLLDAWRGDKDWGGCVPADVHADTVLVLDVLPLSAGADITPPGDGLDLGVQVSHHGPSVLRGRICCRWGSPGCSVRGDDSAPRQAQAATEVLEVEPYVLSAAEVLRVPPREVPGRLVLWFEDEGGRTVARSFIDAAEVEPPNRRGARPGEFVGAPRPGED